MPRARRVGQRDRSSRATAETTRARCGKNKEPYIELSDLTNSEITKGVDEPTPMHEATKENLLALIAESDDDEDAWAADLEEELFS